MNDIYANRLLKFADHLAQFTDENPHREHGLTDEVELVALEKKVRIHYKVLFHVWVFEELPAVFDDWYFSEQFGSPLYEGANPEEGTVAAVIDWFGLSQDMFVHLFDIEGGFQNCEQFGGAVLSPNSSGLDIAINISDLVKIRRKYEEG